MGDDGGIEDHPRRPPLLDADSYDLARRPPNASEPDPVILEIPSISHRTLWLTVFGAVLAAVGAAVMLVWMTEDSTVTQRVASPLTFQEGSNLTFDGEAVDIQGVLARVQPSVVTIHTGQETLRGVFEGAGSGVVISGDGLILTNAHVIAGADQIEVLFFDGTVAAAELVGSFPDDDVALIQAVDVMGTTPAVLGSSEALRVGDEVVAIGNALNLGATPSVTRGIVSAKGRSIDAGLITLSELIQTDAAINPGNSGGPLVNAAGEVVGINTAIIDNAQNVGFAISIDVVKPLIDLLVAGGGTITPDTAFLGVTTQTLADLSSDLLSESGIIADDGAYVVEVVPGAAAADAGLRAGDVIVGMDGQAVDSSEDVGRIVRGRSPGDVMALTIERDGERLEIEATLGARGN